jgi:hypothetical protein
MAGVFYNLGVLSNYNKKCFGQRNLVKGVYKFDICFCMK